MLSAVLKLDMAVGEITSHVVHIYDKFSKIPSICISWILVDKFFYQVCSTYKYIYLLSFYGVKILLHSCSNLDT